MRSRFQWRAYAAILAAALSIGLSSCGSDDGGGGGNQICRGLCDLADCSCVEVVGEKTIISSAANPADTPGSPGVEVDPSSKLFTQFGTTEIDLNNATYTRYHIDSQQTPDAILILVPGFEGGASDFEILAEQLLPRVLRESDLIVEVWAYDRRGDQLEDRSGLVLAEQMSDEQLALDWLFGAELGLNLDPRLPRRAVIYNSRDDIPFLANWTPLVFSRDIDAVVEAARSATDNVFLGGHSAGTGFTARYAATDFDLDGSGDPEPGYTKLRGLVLLEGGGGSTAGTVSEENLDRIEARFDGGLFGAVRAGAPRCVDGVTPCTVATEDTACAAFANAKCTEPTLAYAEVPGLLNTRILASVEPSAIQGRTDPDSGLIILLADQNGVQGNNAISRVPDLAGLAALGRGTVMGGVGAFVDDDGVIAGMAAFVAMSVGFRAPRVPDALMMWTDITENVPPQAFTDNGPPPTSLPLPTNSRWGVERESVRFDRLLELFIGETNFLDWYFPSSGLGVTAGLPGLDSSALSAAPPLGRGRRDIENLTQAANVDVPVICFGGSNGLATVPAAFLPFANSIGVCRAPSCDGTTARVVDAAQPNPAFPTFGGPEGGFEVHISEGYAHVDVVVAEDVEGNEVIGPLAAFLARNTER
jgi:pimeloyl-ACP methyl ester carboxylesterase